MNIIVLKIIFQGFQNNKGIGLEASFSPDSQFAFVGKY